MYCSCSDECRDRSLSFVGNQPSQRGPGYKQQLRTDKVMFVSLLSAIHATLSPKNYDFFTFQHFLCGLKFCHKKLVKFPLPVLCLFSIRSQEDEAMFVCLSAFLFYLPLFTWLSASIFIGRKEVSLKLPDSSIETKPLCLFWNLNEAILQKQKTQLTQSEVDVSIFSFQKRSSFSLTKEIPYTDLFVFSFNNRKGFPKEPFKFLKSE